MTRKWTGRDWVFFALVGLAIATILGLLVCGQIYADDRVDDAAWVFKINLAIQCTGLVGILGGFVFWYLENCWGKKGGRDCE